MRSACIWSLFLGLKKCQFPFSVNDPTLHFLSAGLMTLTSEPECDTVTASVEQFKAKCPALGPH